jgi:cytochrome c peroxidase
MKHALSLAALAVLTLAPALQAQGGAPTPPAPGAFPPLPPSAFAPAQNPTTPEKVILGKMLFWDEQLSSDNSVACGTCHREGTGGGDPRVALNPGLDGIFGTDDDKQASPGVRRSNAFNRYVGDATFDFDVQVTGRTSPSMINAAFVPEMFWDGRASSQFINPETGAVSIPFGGALESQAAGPPLSGVEMSHDFRDWPALSAKLAQATPLKLASNLTPDIQAALAVHGDYPALFTQAFGDPTINAERIAFAIASYERTLISDQSPWDLYNAGNPNALTPSQLAGAAIFFGPGQCNVCHSAPLFSDNQFHSLGLRPLDEDAGRFDVTGNLSDRGLFKTPTLRNSGLRPRFMHNGEFATMDEVNQFYSQLGGPVTENKSPVLALANFAGPTAIAQLSDFVANALTDPRVAQSLPPFDRPTLRSEAMAANNPVIGNATPGSGGVAPQIIADAPANIGNSDFKVGVVGGPAGAPAFLAVSPTTTTLNIGGLGIFVDPNNPDLVFYPRTLKQDPATGMSAETVRIPIANAPALIGYDVYAQWFVLDSGAANPLGYSASAAARFTVF